MDVGWICFDNPPDFLLEAAETPELRRLSQVGMNCGCEYTALPQFRGLAPYSRLRHSLGVGLIVWRFTGDRAAAMAGLLHDVATPAFAHTIDFLRGDPVRQEATEAGTETVIAGSEALRRVLRRYGLSVADVSDYHRYPLADSPLPRLSADRLEYTLGNGVGYGFCSPEEARALFGNIEAGLNAGGEPELVFRDADAAEAFAVTALRCAGVYASDGDRYAMQILSELLRGAVARGVLAEGDLHTTEPAVIGKLLADERTARAWRRFRAICGTVRADAPDGERPWRRVYAKKRAIDPFVRGRGRVSRLSPRFAEAMRGFLNEPQDAWLLGLTEEEGTRLP